MHLDHINRPAADSGKLGFIAFTYLEGGITGSSKEIFQYFKYNDKNHGSIDGIRRIHFNLPLGWHTRFLGSFNGLICYLRESTYTVCNPITREYIMFPEFKRVRMGHGAYGFGYVDSTNEYKVVRIMFENATDFMEVYIYTLGSGNGWRNIGKLNFGTREHWGEGVYFNGALCWLDYKLKMIVPFHLAEEKFGKHFSPPPLSNIHFDDYYKLRVSDGYLYFSINLLVGEDDCWGVWILKNKDDNHDMKEREGHQSLGWSEDVRVYYRLYCYLFAVTKSCAVLTYTREQINIHGPEASTSETIVDFNKRIGEVFPHKNTLVSLKELGEEDTKIME